MKESFMSCSSPQNVVRAQEQAAHKNMELVGHKILVMSGKGGVGKTTVSTNLAHAFSQLGFSVGILDADLHGPNVALMCGLHGIGMDQAHEQLEPLTSASGIKVLSIASFLEDDSSPVAMRGPRKTAFIRQFIGEANWKDLDILIVDCPPGTGDEPMSVAQLIPDADGVVIVSSPQDVSVLDSKKCIGFVKQMNLPILGVIENMSGHVCEHCGHRTSIFKEGGGKNMALENEVPFLGKIPLSSDIVIAGDSGLPIVVAEPKHPSAKMFVDIANNIKSSMR